MQTKENPAESEQAAAAERGGAESDITDAEALSREETLQWLLELDRDEPEENVFIVARGGATDFSLSAQEAAVAARPMIRGRAGADDLSSYVGEEIVLGEEEGSGTGHSSADDFEQAEFDSLMTVEFSRDATVVEEGLLDVEEGSDILGLEEDDDMGEHYLVVKRVKRSQGTGGAEDASADTRGAPLVPTAEYAGDGDVRAERDAEPPVEALPLAGAGQEDELQFDELTQSRPEENEATEAPDIAADVEPPETPEPAEMLSLADGEAVTGMAAGQLAETGEGDVPEHAPSDSSGDLYLCEDDFPAGESDDLDLAAMASTLDVSGTAGEEDGEDDGEALVAEFAEDDDFSDFPSQDAGLAGFSGLDGLGDIDFSSLETPDSVGESVEFHEDFREVVEAGSVHTLLTPRLPGLMSEVEAALAARLAALSRSGDAIVAEVSIAESSSDVEAVQAEGFESMSAVCSVMPEALSDLDRRHTEAVYLRLQDRESGKLCNRVFHEAPASMGPGEMELVLEEECGDEPDGIEFSEAENQEAAAGGPPAETETEPSGLRLVETRIFEEDLLDSGESLDAQLEAEPGSAAGWAPGSDEIDAIFGDLESDDPLAGALDELPPMSDTEEPFSTGEAEREAVFVASDADEDMAWCIPENIEFAVCSPSGGEIFAEFLDAFIEEGSAELEKLETAVSAWESDSANPDHPAEVGRVLHTIKGIAKGVGLHYFGTLVHNFETLLEEMPQPSPGEGAGYFRIVNAWLDAVVRGMDFVQQQRRDIEHELPGQSATAMVDAPGEPVVAKSPAKAYPSSAEAVRRKEEDKKLADEGARALAAQQSVRITSEKLDLLLNLTNQAQQLGVRTTQASSRTKRATAELQGRLTSVRAHIADIANGGLFNASTSGGSSPGDMDALEMDRYSELQEAANILREGVEDLADLIELVSRHNGQSEALLKQQATVISSIGSSIRAARVVPVSRLTPGLRRLVRTVSADLRKEVAFRVVNEVGTLDRDDYARCQTILEHMVRNALDHGLESAAERRVTGKPSVGQITLDLRKSGADTVIVLSDDGRGMDPDRIRASARSKGVGGDVDALSDEEALNLVFHKGFSTASEVSQISGRGVGMDIVASELQKMGGEVRITSEVDKGTVFHVRIPTNVAVNGALLVSAGDVSYAIPLGGLVLVDEIPVDKFFSAVENRENLTVAGFDCEPAYLGTLCQSGNLPERSAWRHTIPVLVAGSESRRMAIAVDDVEEALELVIRTLGAQFAAVPGVAGAATTADGEAVVALDLNVLVSSLGEGQGMAVAIDRPREDKLLALVVDDSRTQRMVATSQLESVGLETATAENGAVAIDWLNTTERLPDIVLMDVEMPVKDGIQALREIRKSPRFGELPVIMITSRTGIKHRTLAEEAGCNGYMGKPFNFRMLMGQINELTGHRLDLESPER